MDISKEREELIKEMRSFGVTHLRDKNPYTMPIEDLKEFVQYLQEKHPKVPVEKKSLEEILRETFVNHFNDMGWIHEEDTTLSEYIKKSKAHNPSNPYREIAILTAHAVEVFEKQ